MNRKEAERLRRQKQTLVSLGFTEDEAEALRRISMTLRRWFELECGDGSGWCIERDGSEDDSPPYMRKYDDPRGHECKYRIPDRETGARKRLSAIIGQRNGRNWHPIMPEPVSAFIQTDPRGAALYIMRPGDIPEGQTADICYSRGICVY